MSAITLMQEMTEEFINEEGFVTCEFSTSKEAIRKIRSLIRLENQRLNKAGFNSKWISHECDTCAKYHGPECNIHLEIVSIKGGKR